jgi:hypothetical protein
MIIQTIFSLLFRRPQMTSNGQPTPNTSQASGPRMRDEIAAKWGKFTTQEIADLKDNKDLVTQVQSKYQLDNVQAQRDVDAFAKGRQL